MLTEDEAKTKRCCGPEGAGRVEFPERQRGAWRDYTPQDGIHVSEIPAYTQLAMRMAPRFCIGSACTAWRWNIEHEAWDGAKGPPPADWKIMRWRYRDRHDPMMDVEVFGPTGYCGIAGR